MPIIPLIACGTYRIGICWWTKTLFELHERRTLRVEMADVEAAFTAALNGQPMTISYPEYKPTDDFSQWLSGYEARVRNAYGFKLEENDKVQEEVVRSISGQLTVGTALDTYNRLDLDDKMAYAKLVRKLSEEFSDPQARKKFNSSTKFNVRKEGESLKDFMQAIKKDMARYSSLPDEVRTEQGQLKGNDEKERQGVRRFIHGMRAKSGEKDKMFQKHLEHHLQEDKELTWANALKVATRYEIVWGNKESTSSENSSDEDPDDGSKASACRKKEKASKKTEGNVCISAIADQVHENQMRIKGIEAAQERLAEAQEELAAAQETTNAALLEISMKLDWLLGD